MKEKLENKELDATQTKDSAFAEDYFDVWKKFFNIESSVQVQTPCGDFHYFVAARGKSRFCYALKL